MLHACQLLEHRGVHVTYVPAAADGVIDAEDVRRSLRPETVLISVMHANNELGTLQPIAEIGRIAAEEPACGFTLTPCSLPVRCPSTSSVWAWICFLYSRA